MFAQGILLAGSSLITMLATSISVEGVAIATAVVGGTGLFIGLFLGVAAKKLAIAVDETEASVRELLPGSNCGGCGYPGCDGLAKAIAAGEAPVNACPVANQAAYDQIAAVMGVEAEAAERKVAYVKCAGSCDKAGVKYEYYGVQDCNKATMVPGKGNKKCSFGCMGFGSCVKACQFDAIHIVDGIAVVDKAKCTGCKQCIITCPNNIIELVPEKAAHLVTCNSNDKGKDVKAACSVGCIGCKKCEKVCEFDAIKVENNLAHIDYSKCTNCGKCAESCPTQIIHVEKRVG